MNCSCHKESGTFATPESDTSIRTVDSSNFFSETCPSRCSPRRFSSPGDSQQALMQAYQRNSSAGAAPWLSSPSFSPQMHAFSLGSPPLMPDVGTVTPPKSPYRCLFSCSRSACCRAGEVAPSSGEMLARASFTDQYFLSFHHAPPARPRKQRVNAGPRWPHN